MWRSLACICNAIVFVSQSCYKIPIYAISLLCSLAKFLGVYLSLLEKCINF